MQTRTGNIIRKPGTAPIGQQPYHSSGRPTDPDTPDAVFWHSERRLRHRIAPYRPLNEGNSLERMPSMFVVVGVVMFGVYAHLVPEGVALHDTCSSHDLAHVTGFAVRLWMQ